MINRLIKYLVGACLLLPLFSHGQSLVWENSVVDADIQSLSAIAKCDSGYLAYGTGRYAHLLIDQTAELLKFDHSGNLMWKKKLLRPNVGISVSKAIVRVKEENNFICSGRYIQGSTYDFIYKINSTGDTIWTHEFQYLGFYESMRELLVLKDKSVVSVGWNQYPNTMADVIARRIDSLGNLMWEKNYPIPGNQEAWDIVEMLDGSLVIAANDNNGDNLLIRIGFDGRLIGDTILGAAAGIIVGSGNLVTPNNSIIGVNHVTFTPNPFGNAYLVDENLATVNNWTIGPNIENLSINKDSISLIREFINGYETGLYQLNFMNQKIDSFTFAVDNTIRDITDFARNMNNIILSGAKGTSSDRDYWLAKISGVGEEWIPDRCAYQPPVAGFEYEYNYPILTLRDTSTGGLKYLDTVYTWQWNTSVGQGGTMDSAQIFFDTAITKSINVQLVISNWYGCTDTVNKTLIFDPNGISEEKPLDVKIYPNPVSDVLHIDFSAEVEGDILFEIFDLHGTKLNSETFTEPGLRSSVSRHVLGGLPSGMYFYTISSASQVRRGKLIKQ